MSIRLLLAFCLLTLAGLIYARTGTKHYYYTDPQGTVLAKADAQGNIVEHYEYTPYGAPMPGMGAAPDGAGYTGHVNDPETGLVYMLARYYDPAAGRFLSADPIAVNSKTGANSNRYWYANNNPYKFVDPDGRESADLTLRSITAIQASQSQMTPEQAKMALTMASIIYSGGASAAGLRGLPAGIRTINSMIRSAQQVERAHHTIPKDRSPHIFRGKEGHLNDTPQNRATLQRVADAPETTLGTDRYGNTWSAQQNKDGSQTWTQTRNGEIRNGGVNETPKQYDPETGLSRPLRSN